MDGVVRAHAAVLFHYRSPRPRTARARSERESARSGTPADFWRNAQDTRATRARVQPGSTLSPRSRGYQCRPRVQVPLRGDRPQQRRRARSATGFSPRRAARSTSAHRSAARAPVEQRVRRPPAARVGTPPAPRPTYAGSRSKRSRLPRSVNGCPAWANSQSSSAGDLERVRVDQQVLGVEVAVHQAGRGRRCRAGPGPPRRPRTSAARSARPSSARGARSTHSGRPAVRGRRRCVRSASTNGPARSIGIPREVGQQSPRVAAPERGRARRRRARRAARSPRSPGRNDVTSSPGMPGGRRRPGVPPGPPAPAPARAPAAAPPRRPRGVGPARRRRAGRSAPRCARRRLGEERLARTSRRPAGSATARAVHALHRATGAPWPTAPAGEVRSGRAGAPAAVRARRAAPRRRGRVAARQRPRLGPLRRRVPGHARRVPRRRRLRVGPRGPHRGRRSAILGDVAGQRRARGRLRRRPVLALGARRTAAAASASTSRYRQLQHSRRIDEETGRGRARRCAAPRPHLPFADDSFDVVFCSFGALQFVARHRPTRSPRSPGCCAPAGASRSRSPTRPGGCSPTTPARPA